MTEHVDINSYIAPKRGLMTNESWFQDRKVNWNGSPTKLELAELVIERSNQLRRRPRNGLAPDFWQQILADNLGFCSKGNRCGMACCPNCSTAVQRWLTSNIVRLASQETKNHVGALSIVPSTPLIKILTAAELQNTITTVREKLESTGLVEWAIICLDISWNDFRAIAKDWPDDLPTSGWCPHAYAHVKVKDIPAFKGALQKLFPPTTGVPVPVKRRNYDGTTYGASYAFKGEFQRRVSFFDNQGNISTKDYRLPTALNIQVMRTITELGLGGRIELIGLEVIETKGRKIELALEKLAAGKQGRS